MYTTLPREANDTVLKIQSELHGLTDCHLMSVEGYAIHPALYGPLNTLCYSATRAGFRLQVVSAWRSFDRQRKIWNEKAAGRRPVLDDSGAALARDTLSDEETMWAILRWSALPGASRHHWGTDIDVIDAASVPPGYRVQLTVEETIKDGVFAGFHRWLDTYLRAPDCLFFRPYLVDDGGIAPEPWHLSYAPPAMLYQQMITVEQLREFITSVDIALKPCILANLEEIVARFVAVDWQRYPLTGPC